MALVLALAGCGADAGTEQEPRAFPDFDLPPLRGEGRVRSADFAGTPAVVNFFASWCTPCKRELPLLVRTAERYEGRVAFVGIDHQDSRTEAVELLDRYGIAYPTGYDPDGTVRAKLPQTGLPVTAFVHADGTIASVKLGELKEADLVDRIDQLLERS